MPRESCRTLSKQPDDCHDDLGPLAWVLGRTAQVAGVARQVVAPLLRMPRRAGADIDARRPGRLRIARQQLHQARRRAGDGGSGRRRTCCAPWKARSRSSSTGPSCCTDAAAVEAERAVSALIEYLEAHAGAARRCRRCRCSRSTRTCRTWPAPTASTRPTCGASTGAGSELAARACRARCATTRPRAAMDRRCCASSRPPMPRAARATWRR